MVRAIWVIVAVVATGAVVVAGYFQWSSNQPVNGATSFTIDAGDGVSVVARKLADRRIVDEPYSFIVWSYLSGSTAALKAGEYEIDDGMSLRRLLARFVAGDVVTYSVTLVEGWTFEQFLSTLSAHPLLARGLEGKSSEDIMRKIRISEEQIVKLPKLHENGLKMAEICRQKTISEQTYYRWKSKSDNDAIDALCSSPTDFKLGMVYLNVSGAKGVDFYLDNIRIWWSE